jgi:hypothetical protein
MVKSQPPSIERNIDRRIASALPETIGKRLFPAEIELDSVAIQCNTCYIGCLEEENTASWLMLTYSLSAEPSSARVRIWRKLKRLGALPCFESNWVLPDNPRCREMLTWLCAEILEAEGKAVLWTCTSLFLGQDESLEAQFLAQVDSGYDEILSSLDSEKAELDGTAREYLRLRQADYFGSRKGVEVRRRLDTLRNATMVEAGGSE